MSWIYYDEVDIENLATTDRTAWVHSEFDMMVAIEEILLDGEQVLTTVAYETVSNEPWPTILPHRTHYTQEDAEKRCEEMRRELDESVEFIDRI